MDQVKWMHPAHLSRAHGEEFPGIRNPSIDFTTRPLTDRAIERYKKLGYYGKAITMALIMILCASCSSTRAVSVQHYAHASVHKARVTFYHRFEAGGSGTSIGVRAHEAVTVAAPKSIPFHTPVTIPKLAGIIGDGHFVVQDRGRLVQDAPNYTHFDIYIECRNRQEARRRMHELEKLEPFMDVYL